MTIVSMSFDEWNAFFALYYLSIAIEYSIDKADKQQKKGKGFVKKDQLVSLLKKV